MGYVEQKTFAPNGHPQNQEFDRMGGPARLERPLSELLALGKACYYHDGFMAYVGPWNIESCEEYKNRSQETIKSDFLRLEIRNTRRPSSLSYTAELPDWTEVCRVHRQLHNGWGISLSGLTFTAAELTGIGQKFVSAAKTTSLSDDERRTFWGATHPLQRALSAQFEHAIKTGTVSGELDHNYSTPSEKTVTTLEGEYSLLLAKFQKAADELFDRLGENFVWQRKHVAFGISEMTACPPMTLVYIQRLLHESIFKRPPD